MIRSFKLMEKSCLKYIMSVIKCYKGLNVIGMKNKYFKLLSLAFFVSSNAFAISNQDNNMYSMYLESNNYKQQQEAYNYFLRNANSDALSLYKVGIANYYGYGVKQDESTAISIFNKAASMKYGPAYTILGKHFIEKENNIPKGLEYLVKAIDYRDGEAAFYIGKMYDIGNKVEKNDYYAVKYYSDGAKLGSSEASYHIGRKMITSGDPSNYDRGISYLKRAASDKHKQACIDLSKIFKTKNNFVKESPRDHIVYLNCAAVAGDPSSQKTLADYYRTGTIVNADDQKAASYYDLYIRQNPSDKDPQLYFYAGAVNMRIGNPSSAITYFEISSNLGNSEASYTLARLYENGYGIKKDLKNALNLYKKAQEGGKDTVDDILRVEGKITQ